MKRLKVGIITFHRTANYGAVLQAFALQRFLMQKGCEVSVIDYVPDIMQQNIVKAVCVKDIRTIPVRMQEYFKFLILNQFVDRNMKLTRLYTSGEDLKKSPPEFDLYISGSDQIWNKYFTFQGEGKTVLTYYLDFVPQDKRKISYAVSMGFLHADQKYIDTVKPFLQQYQAISVREKSAQEILLGMGIHAEILPDPTLLPDVRDYLKFMPEQRGEYTVSYILHEKQVVAKKVSKYVAKNYAIKHIKVRFMSLEKWLAYMNHAKCIITNSYHGIIFAILFHRPFFAIPVEGVGEEMNDRIQTLLRQLGLNHRIVSGCDQADKIMYEPIDWNTIDNELEKYKNKGRIFLEKMIGEFQCTDFI